ncbi:MAG: hypothetical protein ACQEQN_07370 [Thermodesulfobacteriota bacterium]
METQSPNESHSSAHQAESGAPATGKAIHDKFSADEIFQRIIASAREEVHSTFRELFFSGIAAGLAIY